MTFKNFLNEYEVYIWRDTNYKQPPKLPTPVAGKRPQFLSIQEMFDNSELTNNSLWNIARLYGNFVRTMTEAEKQLFERQKPKICNRCGTQWIQHGRDYYTPQSIVITCKDGTSNPAHALTLQETSYGEVVGNRPFDDGIMRTTTSPTKPIHLSVHKDGKEVFITHHDTVADAKQTLQSYKKRHKGVYAIHEEVKE